MSETQAVTPIRDPERRPAEIRGGAASSSERATAVPGEAGTAATRAANDRPSDKSGNAGEAATKASETAISPAGAARNARGTTSEAVREPAPEPGQAIPQPGAAKTTRGASREEAKGESRNDARTDRAPGDAAKQQDAAKPAEDLRQVVLKLSQLATEIGRNDKSLARDVQTLAREVDQPGRTEDAKYRTRVAYAVQDVERQASPINIAGGLRNELATLAGTYPGLQNDRMRDLMANTAAIENRSTVREIRSAAERITRAADQNDQRSMSIVEAMEHKARMAMLVADQTGNAKPAAATPPPAEQTGARAEDASQATRLPPSQPTAQAAVARQQPGRATLDVMAALRRGEPEAPAPWDRQLTPMGDRITAYTTRMREGAEEQIFRTAEKSGRAALAAMTAFAEGPGSVLMARIRDAAKADPNGMTGVLSEMREGGRHAGLRHEFNVALEQEKGFAAAYERAAGNVARFGSDRVEVDKIAAGRGDAAAITGRFQKLDAEIGKAASELPGKADGKSFTSELAERAGEIVRKAVDTVQAAFDRIRTGASPSPGPS